jgi:hypothetical protein
VIYSGDFPAVAAMSDGMPRVRKIFVLDDRVMSVLAEAAKKSRLQECKSICRGDTIQPVKAIGEFTC